MGERVYMNMEFLRPISFFRIYRENRIFIRDLVNFNCVNENGKSVTMLYTNAEENIIGYLAYWKKFLPFPVPYRIKIIFIQGGEF